jgi:hypothetical protein
MAQQLILKRTSKSCLSAEWNDDDYDVVAEGIVVGGIIRSHGPAWRASGFLDLDLLLFLRHLCRLW